MLKENRSFHARLLLAGIAGLFFLLGIIGYGCSVGSGASAIIRGLVYDLSSQPLFGTIATTGISVATTDASGVYQLQSVPTGNQLVTISNPGYTPSYRIVAARANVTRWATLAILAQLDSKITQIDSGGGTVANTQGSVQLVIPSGAISGQTSMTITSVPLRAAPVPPPSNFQFIAVITYITPNTLTLRTPATLSIPNITNLPNGMPVSFYHLNTSNLSWEGISGAGGVASLDAGVITAQISQLGWTAALVPIAPSAGTITGYVLDYTSNAAIANASVIASYLNALTDANGAFVLTNCPTGEISVEAYAEGYQPWSTSVFVTGGQSVSTTLYLTPISGGSIEGMVTNLLSGAVVPNARIMGPNGLETSTDYSGKYSFKNIPGGSVNVYAYANGYLSGTNSGILANRGYLKLDMGLSPTTEAAQWFDDFETDMSWTQEGMSVWSGITAWRRISTSVDNYRNNMDENGYVTLPDYASTNGRIPDAHSGTHVFWFGNGNNQAARGCYLGLQDPSDEALSGGVTANGQFVAGSLISPTIDLTNFGYATLSFWTWWEIEGVNPATGYDRMEVYVGQPGARGQMVWNKLALLNPLDDPDKATKLQHKDWAYTSGGYNTPGRWVEHKFNLNHYVGGPIKLKFYFNSVDSLYNGFRGWVLDDVMVSPNAITQSQVSGTSIDERGDRGEITPVAR